MTVVRELIAKLSVDDAQFRRDVERAAQDGAKAIQRAFAGSVRPSVDTAPFKTLETDAKAAAKTVQGAFGQSTKVSVDDTALQGVAAEARVQAKGARDALEKPIRPEVDTSAASSALRGLAALASTVGIGAILKKTIQTGLEGAGSLETARLQFQTLLGSADKANARVQELFAFAAATPFETGELIQASRVLQTFGGDALASEKSLRRIADAAAAVAAPVADVAFWMGRAVSAIQGGQPFGEAAQRLQELGLLTPQVRQEMENLQKTGASSAQVIDVLNKSFDRFAGASKNLAGTLPGVISTFKDNITLGLASAFDGKPLEQFKKGILGIGADLSGLIGNIAPDLSRLVVVLSDTLGGGLEALAPTIKAVLGLIVELADVGGGVLTESLRAVAPIITIVAEGLTATLHAIEPLTPVIAAAADAWLVYKAAAAIGDVTSLAGAGLGTLATKVGAAAAPLGGIASGLGSVAGILPQVGIAVGVGVGLWALFGNQEKEVINVQDDLIASLGDLNGALSADQIQKIAQGLDDTKGAGDKAGETFIKLAQSGKISGDTLTKALQGSKGAAKELARELGNASKTKIEPAFLSDVSADPKFKKALEATKSQIRAFAIETGQGFGDDVITAAELPKKLQTEFLKIADITKGSTAFDEISFDVVGPDARTLGAISDLIADGQKLKGASTEAADASKALAGDLGAVTESASSAADQMKRFGDLVKEQFGQLDVTERLQELQRALADFKIVDGANNPVAAFTGQLGGLDAVSRNATDSLNDLIGKSEGVIQQAIESGQPLTDVIGKYTFLRGAILQTAESHGIARDKVEEYLASVGFVPDEVTTLLKADAADGKIIVTEWAQILSAIPPDKRTAILATLDEPQRVAVQKAIDDLTKPRSATVTVHAKKGEDSTTKFLLDPFHFLAEGGYFPGRPGGYPAIVGEAGPEVVIPLNDAARARELVSESGLLRVLAGNTPSGSTSTSSTANTNITKGGAVTINFQIQATDPILAAREVEAVVTSVLARSGLPIGV